MEYASMIENFKLDYANLMKYFLNVAKPHMEETSGLIEELKIHYSSVIKSARTADYINHLEGLLRILEKRNELSYDNIEPLMHIESFYLKNPELARLLKNYEELMSERQVVPLFNIYDVPSGKYNLGELREPWHVLNVNLMTKTVHYRITRDNSMNQRSTVNNDLMKLSTSEDELHVTKSLLRDNATTGIEQRIKGFCTIFNDKKTKRKICNKMTLTVSFMSIAFLTILLITIYHAWSSARLDNDQPGISSLGRGNGRWQDQQIRAQMTLYAATDPTFRLTLPGSVEIAPTEQSSSKDSEEETTRMILIEVSDKLGRHWRDVARFLGVTEYDIDEIDYHSQSTLKEKALKALLKFQSKSDPSKWKSQLKRALDKARRRDLMEMVEELTS